jgi:hypothetical protein
MQQIVKFIGKAYVKEGVENDCYVCIDSEDTKGIVLMFIAKENIQNAHYAADALNLWAGLIEQGDPARYPVTLIKQ